MQLQFLHHPGRNRRVSMLYSDGRLIAYHLIAALDRYGKEAEYPFRWTKGSFDEAAKYVWNSKEAIWHFCPTCSVLLLWKGIRTFGVNIRCFDDFSKIDLDNFKMVKYDGANNIPGEAPAEMLKRLTGAFDLLSMKLVLMQCLAEEKPAHDTRLSLLTYPEPEENEEVSQFWTEHPEGAEMLTHKGGCHCRKFEFEYDYPRLDVRPPAMDNCSFCLKHAALLA